MTAESSGAEPAINGRLVVSTTSTQSAPARIVQAESGAELLRNGSSEWWGLPLQDQVRPDSPLHTALSSSKPGEEPSQFKLPSGWWGCSPPARKGPQTGPCRRGVFGPLRRSVSCSRNRYEWDGFDLDLTYVTSRVIAMGIPGKGLAATYRNPVSEVERFLKWAHGDHFRIYNLCAEEKHAANGFPSQTVRYPFFDHSPPPLKMMLDFCCDVEAWLRADRENVAVIHCKAGKGRCGTMACALLVFSGAMPSAYEALRWFARVRGGKRSGVTIPSQIRWIAMFEHWLHSGTIYPNDGAGRTVASSGNALLAALPEKQLPGSDGQGTKQYHLRTLRLGPVRRNLSRLSATEEGRHEAAVLVGIAPREAVTKQRKDLWHWYPEVLVPVGRDGQLLVALPCGGPLLEESEGVLKVRVRRPRGTAAAASLRGALSMNEPVLELSTWWNFDFLQPLAQGHRSAPGLKFQLELPKAYIDGMQADMRRHKLVPNDFRFQLVVEEQPRRPSAKVAAAEVAAYVRGGGRAGALVRSSSNPEGVVADSAKPEPTGAMPRLPISRQSARRSVNGRAPKKLHVHFDKLQPGPMFGACGLLGCLLGAGTKAKPEAMELNPDEPRCQSAD